MEDIPIRKWGRQNWAQGEAECNVVCFLFCFVFVVLEVELSASHLLGRCSTTWVMPPALFVLVVSEIGSQFMSGLPYTMILLFVLPCVAGMTGAPHRTQPLFEMESCKLFAHSGLEL
jgi:hypothetical protein